MKDVLSILSESIKAVFISLERFSEVAEHKVKFLLIPCW